MKGARAILAGAVTAVLVAGAAPAQDLSADEILGVFARQAEAMEAARSGAYGATRSLNCPEGSACRGLKLVTAEDLGLPPPELAGQQTASAAPAPAPGEDFVYAAFAPELQINLRITFAFDSAALSPSEAPKLAAMCAALEQSPVARVRIVGHTDASGSDAYNDRLSLLRAEEVARHLVNECGIRPERLDPVGLGERFPVNVANPRADENRRVEFQALG